MKIKGFRDILVGILIFAAVLIVDQATKYLAFSSDFGSFLSRAMPVFGKELFPNPYFAFSLHVTGLWMYAIYAVLLGLLTLWLLRHQSTGRMLKIGYVLIVAGALSNILDRLMLGYVRDFISVFWGNVFNVADVSIVVGIVMMMFGL